MRIVLAQAKAIKGNIKANINNHLELIKRAITYNVDLIIFPELSMTGYEPELAQELSTTIDDVKFNVFQKTADNNGVTIGLGMPTQATDGINISMLLFQPNHTERLVYSKRILHPDEFPYFVSSDNQPILHIQGYKIALGICYETLQRTHFVKAKENGAEIYVASVSKPDRSKEKAFLHFPSIAKEFDTAILMVNSIGFSDNFMSNGNSSVWNETGNLIGQLDETNQGLLIYDTKTGNTEQEQLRIEKGMS